MIPSSTILVTGGLGAIGSTLCRELLRRGAGKIVILDNCSSSLPETSQDITTDKRTVWIRDSVVNDKALDEAFVHKPDIVFHLAANFANQNSIDHPILDCEVNSLGTMKVLECSRIAGVQKFVYSSSSCVYGGSPSFEVASKDLHPDTPYAINKLHGEYLVQFYHDHHGMNTTTLRYFNSFGPGEIPGKYRNVIPNFFALAFKGQPLPITGTTETSRDFNFIDNTIAATVAAAEMPASNGNTYNIGSGVETPVMKIAEEINAITGNTAGTVFKPKRNWDTVDRRRADISTTVRDLAYTPVIDLPKQLRATYDWLKRYEDLFPPM